MSKLFALASGILTDAENIEHLNVNAMTLSCNLGGKSYTVEVAKKGFNVFDGNGKKACAHATAVRTEMKIADKAKKQTKVPTTTEDGNIGQ